MTGDLVLALLPAVPLAVTVVNLVTWRRPDPGPVGPASALVPARDEESTIEANVRALLAEPFVEVIVYDDGSTDATPRILAALAAQDPRLRVLTGGPLPPGWVGKPHACHHLAAAATTERLVFVDADTTVSPGALSRLTGADVVTALPRQRMETVGEQLVVSLLHLTYLSWLPLELIPRTRSPHVLAANGQVLSVSRAAYDRVGGFAAVRGEIVDDMAFCRVAKRAGLRVTFVDGWALASCRMYRSLGDAVQGFAKNLYEGVGNPFALAAVVVLYVACFLSPWIAWPAFPLGGAVGMALGLFQRALLAHRFRLPIGAVVGHPVGIGLFVVIAAVSASWSARGAIRWRGRVYRARAERA